VKANERFGRLLRPGSLVVLLAATLLAVGAALRESSFPDAGLWKAGHPSRTALLAVAVLTYIGNVLVIVGYRRSLRRSDNDTKLNAACRDLAALVVENTNLERDEVAVHVWEVAGMRGVRRLVRRASFVPWERQQTPVVWRKGKGAIGQCWADGEWKLADLDALQQAAPDEAAFEALDPPIASGLPGRSFARPSNTEPF